MEQAARQWVRAIRGHRSQRQLSMRLGYRSNPVAEWEGGRRFPTAAEFFRAAAVSGVDVTVALRLFQPSASIPSDPVDDTGLARWLDGLRGNLAIGELAERVGASRFAVSRWLSGRTRPRLPDFLRLVQGITGRTADLVAATVPIAQVPALREQHARTLSARELLRREPWALAVLALMEIEHPPATAEGVAAALGIPVGTARRSLAGLVAGRVLDQGVGGWRPTGAPLVIDTPDEALLKRHWAQVGLNRLDGGDQTCGYMVFGVGQADLERLRELHLAYYRQVRAIASASTPTERVAVLNLQLIPLSGPGSGGPTR